MRESVVALAHKIKLNEANWQKKYLTSLVETAFFYHNKHSFSDLPALQEFLKSEDILPLKIFNHEWESTITSLLSKKSLVQLPYGGWKLTESKINDLQKEVNEWIQLEEKVKKDWICELDVKYSNISENEKNILWRNLKEKFILKLFLRHGAETTKIVFGHSIPVEEKFSASLYVVLRESIIDIPSHLHSIAEKEFPLFFDPNNDTRRQYLITILDSTFSHLAITIPERNIKDIYKVSSFEWTLLLDTNFLFSVLGLHEHHMNESAKEIFVQAETLSRVSGGKAKIKFCCAPQTLREFEGALDSCLMRLKNIELSRSVAKAAVKSNYFQSIDMVYFKKCEESNTGINPEQFFSPYRNGLNVLLKNKGITLFNDAALKDINTSQEVVDDIHDFKDYLEKRSRERSWDTMNHDITLWHLIKRRRESSRISKQYIITCDYIFVAFDRYKFRGQEENNICLLPTHLLQMIGLFVPRTVDLEKALITFMKIPMAKHMDAETETVSLKILGTIAIYKDFSGDVATELLTDEALRSVIKNAATTEEVRKLIEDKLSKDLEIERREREKARIELHEKGTALLQKDTKISDLEANLEEKSKKIQEYEKQLEEIKETNMKIKEQLEKLGKSQSEMETREKVRKEWWDWLPKLLPWKW